MTAGEFWFEGEDGLRLFSRVHAPDRADAPAVVCLHGLTRNGHDFGELAPYLGLRFRVLVPDVRGRGLSARDPDPANYSLAVYLRDLEALLGAFGAERVAIIGTSM